MRFKIERVFGTLKRTWRFRRARYLGRAKTEAEFHLAAIAFNIKKAIFMLSWGEVRPKSAKMAENKGIGVESCQKKTIFGANPTRILSN